MRLKKTKREPANALRARVSEEMARPRMARSARIAELNLDPTRIPERPSASVPGIVDKIIPPLGPSQAQKTQIAVERADPGHRDLHDARLKKGAHVEVTVTAEPKPSSTAKNGDGEGRERKPLGGSLNVG
jgi:hypothetical protein